MLGYAPMGDDAGSDPLGHGSTVWMQRLDEARPLHDGCTSTYRSHESRSRDALAAVLAAGGRVVWESPEHWTLADRAGNKVDITAWPDGGAVAPRDPI